MAATVRRRERDRRAIALLGGGLWRRRSLTRLGVLLAVVAVAVLAIAAVAGGTQQYETYEAAVAADGPVTQYRFDDAAGSPTLADSAGVLAATNDGIALGGEGPFGGSKVGSFASGAYAALPSSPLSSAGEFTLEAWVYWSGGSSYNQPIAFLGSGAGNLMQLTPASSASGHPLTFEIVHAAATYRVTAAKLAAKAWKYVVVTETSVGVLTLYVNGVKLGEATAALTPASLGAVEDDYLGKSAVAGTPAFAGSLSNVAFYTRALTEARVEAHYRAAEFPVAVSSPTITGKAKDGSTLTAKEGSWIGLKPIEFQFQWELCSATGEECTPTGPPSSETKYALGHSTVGDKVRVTVLAANEAGGGEATSAPTAIVEAIKLVNTGLPVITGSARVGQELTVSNGTWSGTPPTAYYYAWESCAGKKCHSLGDSSSSFEVTSAQLGDTIRAVVTAENEAGAVHATSAATAGVTAGPPRNVGPPTVSGEALEGQELSAGPGVWAGTEPITYSYQWERCTSPEACTHIPGANGPSYVLASGDVGHTVRVAVTATNSVEAVTAASAETKEVQAKSPPVNVGPPTISGEARDGHVLSASHGEWEASEPVTYAYQWQDCQAEHEEVCSDIAHATGSVLHLQSSDVGAKIRVIVTATDADGSAHASSADMGVVAAVPPESYEAPTIAGVVQDGQELTAEVGAWHGSTPLAFAYEWQRCDAEGGECASIPGAAGQSLVLTHEDVGATITVVVSASNRGGSASATAAPTEAVAALAPWNQTRPIISGAVEAGATLSVSTGTWNGTPPLSYAYQWESCNPQGQECAPILGAEASSYDVGPLEQEDSIRAVVTASNLAGSASVTVAVGGAAIVNTSQPSILGVARVGSTLSALAGAWSGSAPIEYAYQWEACAVSGEPCANIPGADTPTYTPAEAQTGDTLRVVVTATNPSASVSATSQPTPVLLAEELIDRSAPTISGTPAVGETLSASVGRWAGPRPISFSYGWERCSQSTGECSSIAEAHSASYAPTSADLGDQMQVTVTATSGERTSQATSGQTAAVASSRPSNSAPPVIAGVANVGQLLRAQPGIWAGSGLSFDYQWERCSAQGTACTPIAGAEEETFTPSYRQEARTIRVVVSASNALGSSTAVSAATTLVRSELSLTDTSAPSVTGTQRVGSRLEVDPGVWSGDGAIGYSYQWQRCSGAGTECSPISGATAATYTPVAADAGHRLQVVVTAADANGPVFASSPPSQQIASVGDPAIAGSPVIAGSPEEGRTLTAQAGSWSSSGEISYAYQWQACDEEGEGCEALGGATASTYQPTSAVVGKALRVQVTARNATGSTLATSAASAIVGAAFENVTLPTIARGGYQEVAFTATPGLWASGGTLTYAYQWKRCDSSGRGCIAIAGATGPVYYQRVEDGEGATLKVAVTATYLAHAITAESEPIAAGETPSAPWISGNAEVGGTLSAEAPAAGGPYSYEWRRCEREASGCKALSEATSRTYLVQSADLEHDLDVVVRAAGAEAPQLSAPVWVGAPLLPAEGIHLRSNATSTLAGVTLEAELSRAAGTEPIATAVEWQRCNSSGEDCAGIAGASGAAYTTTDADIGATLRARATYTNRYGSVSGLSSASAAVGEAAPTPLSAPILAWKGNLEPGTTVSVDAGAWAGNQPVAFEYQWQLCEVDGSSCTPIEGASASTYQLEAEQAGHTLAVSVTASNALGSTPAQVGGAGYLIHAGGGTPEGLTSPTVSGEPQVGSVLSASPGVWSNASAGTAYRYRWLRCVERRPELQSTLEEFHEGRECSPIYRADEPTYTPESAGYTVMVEVTAENPEDLSGRAFSTQTAPISAVPPHDRTLPSISGEVVPGNMLAANPGTWENGYTYEASFRWLGCNAHGEACSRIPGATTGYYKVPTEATGTLRVEATLPGLEGAASATAVSNQVSIATASAPTNTVRPTLSGRAQDGTTLTMTKGSWSGSAKIEYGYEWQRCPAEGPCAAIPGAGELTYQLTRADVGDTVYGVVIATNGAGSRSASTGSTATVAPAEAPVELSAPALDPIDSEYGGFEYGRSVFLEQGAWSGDAEVADQWERCDPTTVDPSTGEALCAEIEGATGLLYTPTFEDIGYQLRVRETATNAAGSASAVSPMGEEVRIDEAQEEGATYSGTLVVGNMITASDPVSTEPELPTSAEYEFERRAPNGALTRLQKGAGDTYTITGADVGSGIVITITTTVTAPGNGAIVYQTAGTTTTAPIKTSLADRSIPSISGAFAVGSVLHAATGAWASPEADTTYAYQWYSCAEDGQDCSAIAGATDSTMRLAPEQLSRRIRLTVTADDGPSTGSESSEATPVVSPATPPTNTVLPTITGTAQAGTTLSASPGSWSSSGPINYRYHWEICTEPELPCSRVAGADGAEYVPHANDVGGFLQVEVTAIGGGAFTQASSPATATIAAGAKPTNTVPPVVTVIGPPNSEAILTASSGSWEGLETEGPGSGGSEALAYQWERCNEEGQLCRPIANATRATYDASLADVHARDRVAVSAENSGGELTVLSAPGPVISGSDLSARNALAYVEGESLFIAAESRERPTAILRCEQLRSITGEASCLLGRPAISPNGQLVAVEARPLSAAGACHATSRVCPDEDNSPQAHVVLVNIDGGEVTALPIQAGQPTWEPEGTGLVVTQTSEGLGGPVSQLARVNLLEPSVAIPIALPEGVDSAQSPSFTADGGQLAFACRQSMTARWAACVGDQEGNGAEPVTFPGLEGVDDPSVREGESEDGEEIVFSAVDPSQEPLAAYEGTWPRAIYTASLAGSEVRRLTGASVDVSSPRLLAGGSYFLSTERAPREGGGGLIVKAWETSIPYHGGTPRSYRVLEEAGEPLEAAPAAPSESYSTEPLASESEADRALASRAKPAVTLAQPPEKAIDAPALAREFEPSLHVDYSDGFTPVAESWMLKLGEPRSNGSKRSELCGSSCHKVSYNLALGPGWGTNDRIKYPTSEDAIDAEFTTVNSLNEWFLERITHNQNYWHQLKFGEKMELDEQENEIESENPYMYYVFVHRGGLLTIDYWFYYTYNYFNSIGQNCQKPPGCSYGFHDLHQGDWENVEVVLNHPTIGPWRTGWQATSYVVSRHSQHAILAAGETKLEGHTKHVMIYAAHGDHANYGVCRKHGSSFEREIPLSETEGVFHDVICSERYARPIIHQSTEIGEYLIGGGRAPLENLASTTDIGRFSCWKGQFGYQHPSSLQEKVGYGDSPVAPLQQLDPALKEAGRLCPYESRADT